MFKDNKRYDDLLCSLHNPGAHGKTTTKTLVDSTCIEDGISANVCDECREIVTSTPIPAKGHSYGSWMTFYVGQTDGGTIKYRICDECGHVDFDKEADWLPGHVTDEFSKNHSVIWISVDRESETCKICGGAVNGHSQKHSFGSNPIYYDYCNVCNTIHGGTYFRAHKHTWNDRYDDYYSELDHTCTYHAGQGTSKCDIRHEHHWR